MVPRPWVKPSEEVAQQRGDEGDADEAGSVSDSDECCAICFEHRDFVELPCACKVSYCSACWDRALAASVATHGRARCPSCRSVLRVDFDPVAGASWGRDS